MGPFQWGFSSHHRSCEAGVQGSARGCVSISHCVWASLGRGHGLRQGPGYKCIIPGRDSGYKMLLAKILGWSDVLSFTVLVSHRVLLDSKRHIKNISLQIRLERFFLITDLHNSRKPYFVSNFAIKQFTKVVFLASRISLASSRKIFELMR